MALQLKIGGKPTEGVVSKEKASRPVGTPLNAFRIRFAAIGVHGTPSRRLGVRAALGLLNTRPGSVIFEVAVRLIVVEFNDLTNHNGYTQ